MFCATASRYIRLISSCSTSHRPKTTKKQGRCSRKIFSAWRASSAILRTQASWLLTCAYLSMDCLSSPLNSKTSLQSKMWMMLSSSTRMIAIRERCCSSSNAAWCIWPWMTPASNSALVLRAKTVGFCLSIRDTTMEREIHRIPLAWWPIICGKIS